ncbi:MAG: 3-hydroxyacyl-CoA dehydrogenase [Rhodospirillum sp.]|nr:3-hydroxyacyl-CoA dehydrogenase [Rhodospirillum sp.]MCF8490218.1 3-hydroxyacyl-CoA dehydrogenase [Rhodospirillum sp.]MCF8502000.1 3-hydroxyacyl-CoA dehydrogenase [Rhodospirillum sp.]
MTATLRGAAVLGAGSMGGGIAAQFANAGIPVLLLDLTVDTARAGLARQVKVGAFMAPSARALVNVGGIDHDLDRLAGVDWIVEAVSEDLSLKRDLFTKVDRARKPGTAISSNTSTIPLSALTEGMNEAFSRDLVITHFFNPVRYMRLVELVIGPSTTPETATLVRESCDRILGKRIIDCRDTPAFIANRVGCYWMTAALMEAFTQGLSVEATDAAAGRPFGVPPTGIFGLLDLVGIDLLPSVWGSLLGALPPRDAHQAYAILAQPRLRDMIARGLIGRKAGGGFYRRVTDARGKHRDVIDLETGAYRPEIPAAPAPALPDLIAEDSPRGRYAWAVLSNVLTYAATIAGEIAEDVRAIDQALELGYNWRAGPFALADQLGATSIAKRLRAEARPVPPLLAEAAAKGGFYKGDTVLSTAGGHRPWKRPDGMIRLAELPILEDNGAAILRDMGESIGCLEFRGKMNTIDDALLDSLEAAAARRDLAGLVIANDNPKAFSAGADLDKLISLLDDPVALEAFLARGQTVFRALRMAPFPVVGAPQALALGGGCEMLLHCDAIQAWAEARLGLVERLVGIIPGWGGTTRLLVNAQTRTDLAKGPMPHLSAVFKTIAEARISGSALEARSMGLLRPTDGITMNRDRLLADAKARVLALIPGYAPPLEALTPLPGPTGRLALMNEVVGQAAAGRLASHDPVVLDALAEVISGGTTTIGEPVPETTLLDLERTAVRHLLALEPTRARLRAMRETGKPLFN